MIAQTPRGHRERASRKSFPGMTPAFAIEDLQRINEWRLRPRAVPLQTWIALDGRQADEILCVNLATADRIARWTVMPVRGGGTRFAQASPKRRSWSLTTVANALEAIDAAVAYCAELA